MSTWMRETLAITAKEWRCELRGRTAVSTLALFSFTTLFTVSLAVGPAGASPELRPLMPVLLWVILLFASAAGLPRTFVHEEETGSALALRLAARPSCLFVGKSLYNLGLLLVIEVLVAPLFVGILRLPIGRPGDFLLALVTGAVGLAVGSTLIAAMAAQASARGPLFAVLAFPVLLPLLKLAIEASFAAAAGEPVGAALSLALLYDGTLIVVGLMLFPVVWNA